MVEPKGSSGPVNSEGRTLSVAPDTMKAASAVPPGDPEITQALQIGVQGVPSHVDADTLLADAERRRKLEQELNRLGMSPEEVRRLLNADSNSTDPLKQSPAGSPPQPSLQQPAPIAAKSKNARPSAGSLNSFASELMTARAGAITKAVKEVSLDLPDFRASSPQEVRQAEPLMREASMLKRREKYVEAEAKCREALTLVPKDGAALELLGDILQGVARIDEAIAAYRRAVEADPKRSSAERKYGELLVQQQRWFVSDPEAAPKKPMFAILLSLLLPGLGQFHNGDIGKGICFLIADLICYYLLALSPLGFAGRHLHHGLNIGLIACITSTVVIYLGSAYDAFTIAKKGGRRPGGGSGWDV